MIRAFNIINPIDVLGLGTEYYVKRRYVVGICNIQFVGDGLFTYYSQKYVWGTEPEWYESRYVNGDGDNVVSFSIGRQTSAVLYMWLTLYNVKYLKIGNTVIFDKR